MSARLFACFTLVSEKESNDQQTGRTTRRGHSHKLPTHQLLQSLVHVESSSLGQTPVEKKTVQFSAYEGSATRPPRDSVLGSHVPRHVSIQAMVDAMETVNHVLQSHQERDDVLACLKSLGMFLKQVEHADEGKVLRQLCAKSMPFQWVPQRFQKAARLYRLDVEKLCQCLQNNITLKEADVQLNLEKKLAESLGRAIRYHLRRFFNSIYGKVTEDPGLAEPAFKRRSKIHEILRMTLPAWYYVGTDSAVADGSISSIFSLAVETIDREFGADAFLATDFQVPPIPDSFCSSEASQRGIERTCTIVSEEDMETVMSDVIAAQSFLTGAKACGFMTELLNWPGVTEEIARLGGWKIIEEFARHFHAFNLKRLAPHEGHFVLLSDVTMLQDRVKQCWTAMEQASKDCTTELNQQWVRFDCDNKKRKLPLVAILRDLLLEGLKAHMFPNIAEPEEEEEEDDNADIDASTSQKENEQ